MARTIESRLRALIGTLPILLWETGEDGTILLSEGGGLASLGYKPGELVGQSVFDLYRDFPDVLLNTRRALAGNDVATVVEVGPTTIESRLHALRDDSGKVVGTIGLGIDITQRAQHEKEIRGITRRLWSLLEEDRRRIARELHDEVGQTVTALKLELDLARMDDDPATLKRRLDHARSLAGSVVEELRRVAHDLRPSALEDLGLSTAVKALVDRFRSTSQVAATLKMPPELPSLDRDFETAIYRFVQEALTNVSRHAGARKVLVEVEQDADRLRVLVEDDGRGFVLQDALSGTRLGLAGMLERARVLGGSLTIDSTAGNGTRLNLALPMAAPEVSRA
jgi:two-component system sensor histidine kinase UhpB